MRGHFFFAKASLLLVSVLVPCRLVRGQQPTFLIPVDMKGQWLRGSVAIAQHENDGMIGINGKGTEAGYKVETVMPGGPAASAGIFPGDVVVALDGTSIKGLDTSEALKLIATSLLPTSTNFRLDFFALLWYFMAIAALLSKRVLIPDSNESGPRAATAFFRFQLKAGQLPFEISCDIISYVRHSLFRVTQ